MDLTKSLFHVTSRGAERVLPPMALWFLLLPLNELLAARFARRSPHDRVPAARLPLPVDSPRPSTFRRWRHFSREQRHWWLLGWIDRLSAPKWQHRLETRGLEKLTLLLAERPVIVCSLHTTPVMTLAAWLRGLGIRAAHVAMDLTWFSSPARMRKAGLAEKIGVPFVLNPEGTRDIVEFLAPGHALVLTSDFTGGRVTEVEWRDATVTVATGMFRLARSTGAAIVPVTIFETGRWRYEITVFDAVPEGLIQSSDTDEAARYVVDCLIPPVVARPEQALGVLVETIKQLRTAL